MNSEFAISIVTELIGQIRAPTAINYYYFKNCSSNINDTNRCCDITRSIINSIIGCGIRRVYNNIYLKYNLEQHNLFWYNMDCNPGICPILSKEEGAGLYLHASEIPLIFGTESDYRLMNPGIIKHEHIQIKLFHIGLIWLQKENH
ncbi:unnamed protein product [Rotaria sp. Silwood2]|nr:unnamed protein product [Rotaria sp. Silwood2]